MRYNETTGEVDMFGPVSTTSLFSLGRTIKKGLNGAKNGLEKGYDIAKRAAEEAKKRTDAAISAAKETITKMGTTMVTIAKEAIQYLKDFACLGGAFDGSIGSIHGLETLVITSVSVTSIDPTKKRWKGFLTIKGGGVGVSGSFNIRATPGGFGQFRTGTQSFRAGIAVAVAVVASVC